MTDKDADVYFCFAAWKYGENGKTFCECPLPDGRYIIANVVDPTGRQPGEIVVHDIVVPEMRSGDLSIRYNTILQEGKMGAWFLASVTVVRGSMVVFIVMNEVTDQREILPVKIEGNIDFRIKTAANTWQVFCREGKPCMTKSLGYHRRRDMTFDDGAAPGQFVAIATDYYCDDDDQGQ